MMAKREREALRAGRRPRGPRGDTGKPRRRAGRGKGRRGRPRWRSLLGWSLLVLLAAPALVILLYAVVAPPVTPLMLIRAIEGEGIDYRWTPLERISPHLVRAVIASEDTRFCAHWGIDFEELQDAFQDWRGGDRLRGASTISMQTVKNIMLWPQRHILRKLLEAWLTPQLELVWSKARILEVYLNVVEMGPGIYGAEAAAQSHFGKPAAQLTAREAALLAAVLPSPRRRSPARPTAYLDEQAAVIHARINQLGPLLDCGIENPAGRD